VAPSRRVALAIACAVLLGGTSACGGSDDAADGPASTDAPVVIPPRTTGDACEDVAGDLATAANDMAGTLTEPTGIDLVRAEAVLADDGSLALTFDTVGPITEAPTPTFFLFQGPPGQITSFELQVSMTAPALWETRLITYVPGDSPEILVDGREQMLDVPVAVDGNRLTLTIPAEQAPTVATLLWAFGTKSGEGEQPDDVIIDDCQSFLD